MTKRTLYIGIVAVLAAASIAGYLYWQATAGTRIDALLRETFAHAAGTTSYAQHVETRTVQAGNTLRIAGEYLVDDAGSRFASYSTTTLLRAKKTPVVFLLDDIAVGSDVYVRLTNETPGFRLAVPATGTWQHFFANAIPNAYENIAATGPQVDDLKLLSDNGAYLSLVRRDGPVRIHGKNLARYSFKLSKRALSASGGTIRDIASRVGPQGCVDIWIDASSSQVTLMRLYGGPDYTSTTTFSRFNMPLGINAPTGS